ncbi:MAG: hypothetical protein Q4C67_05525 [Deinococcus sp.]|nr:hypothetical protein [Deinococcus sp.]
MQQLLTLLGLPLLLLGILAERLQPGLSDRAFLLTGAYAGAAASFLLTTMAAWPPAVHTAAGATIGLLTALAVRSMWRRIHPSAPSR